MGLENLKSKCSRESIVFVLHYLLDQLCHCNYLEVYLHEDGRATSSLVRSFKQPARQTGFDIARVKHKTLYVKVDNVRED